MTRARRKTVMILSFIMGTVGALLTLSVIIWCTSADYRKRIEEPKYRFLQLTQESTPRHDAAVSPNSRTVNNAEAHP